ncbi:hypothetical protein CGRA01v4_13507 [Colletotrichum graminicola]|nr:hypothetical protein CGRA01v4_13507 [Colletotrichum graminicola]
MDVFGLFVFLCSGLLLALSFWGGGKSLLSLRFHQAPSPFQCESRPRHLETKGRCEGGRYNDSTRIWGRGAMLPPQFLISFPWQSTNKPTRRRANHEKRYTELLRLVPPYLTAAALKLKLNRVFSSGTRPSALVDPDPRLAFVVSPKRGRARGSLAEAAISRLGQGGVPCHDWPL